MIDDYLREVEGFSPTIQPGPAGAPCFGYGHNIRDNPLTVDQTKRLLRNGCDGDGGITEDFADFLLEQDIATAAGLAAKLFGNDAWGDFSHNRRDVFTICIFTMGIGTFRQFKRCISAAIAYDFKTAAKELLDSKAARDEPDKYHKLAVALERDMPLIFPGEQIPKPNYKKEDTPW